MSRSRCLALAFAMLAVLAVPAAARPDRDVLYQISTIDSLLAGLYDGRIRVSDLTKHGDFGMGTFDRLDGEMVVVDGIVYQVTEDGVAHRAPGTKTTPFAAVTFLDAEQTAVFGEMDFATLKEQLDRMLSSKNLFYAIRIDGTFTHMKTRSVPPQSKPYPKLAEVTAHQPTFELAEVKGTLVALRCPYYVRGVNVPGYHMHFLTADRTRGGHVLDCSMKSGAVTLDTTPEFNLVLPTDETFWRMDFEASTGEDLEKVE